MTTDNYSIQGLKNLLDDLGNLSTCIITMPKEHIDKTTYDQLIEDQYNLIQSIICYGNVLSRIE